MQLSPLSFRNWRRIEENNFLGKGKRGVIPIVFHLNSPGCNEEKQETTTGIGTALCSVQTKS